MLRLPRQILRRIVGRYLNLSLQGLNVVDDLVEHHRLPGDLNSVQDTEHPLHLLRNTSTDRKHQLLSAEKGSTLLQPGTRSCRSFILSLIFSLLSCAKDKNIHGFNTTRVLKCIHTASMLIKRGSGEQKLCTLSARLWLLVACPRRARTWM